MEKMFCLSLSYRVDIFVSVVTHSSPNVFLHGTIKPTTAHTQSIENRHHEACVIDIRHNSFAWAILELAHRIFGSFGHTRKASFGGNNLRLFFSSFLFVLFCFFLPVSLVFLAPAIFVSDQRRLPLWFSFDVYEDSDDLIQSSKSLLSLEYFSYKLLLILHEYS